MKLLFWQSLLHVVHGIVQPHDHPAMPFSVTNIVVSSEGVCVV